MPKEDKIVVTRCKDCVYYIGNEYSNVGYCAMWNKSCSKEGYCYHASTELPEGIE